MGDELHVFDFLVVGCHHASLNKKKVQVVPNVQIVSNFGSSVFLWGNLALSLILFTTKHAKATKVLDINALEFLNFVLLATFVAAFGCGMAVLVASWFSNFSALNPDEPNLDIVQSNFNPR
jgi:hypothetical protein